MCLQLSGREQEGPVRGKNGLGGIRRSVRISQALLQGALGRGATPR